MALPLQDHLFALEEKFWKEGASWYRGHLADSVIMVFPEPPGVLVKDEVVSSVSGARWASVDLEEHRLLELSDGAVVVTYRATARRESGEPPYAARASSAYVRDGEAWKLAFHQQTPIAAERG